MAQSDGLSAQERAAVKQRAAELKDQAKRAKAADRLAAETTAQQERISTLPDGDRQLAERIQALVAEVAPQLTPKLYYGMPGYASSDGKVVVFFRSGQVDKTRYSTFGVSPLAALDEAGGCWPTSWALVDPDETAWTQLSEVIRRAAATPQA